jgi:hypothetical protein
MLADLCSVEIQARRISVKDVQEAFLSEIRIIEDYLHDKYGPSCLILGFTKNGRPLHVQVSYPSRTILKIITIYEPDEAKWVDYSIRRQ